MLSIVNRSYASDLEVVFSVCSSIFHMLVCPKDSFAKLSDMFVNTLISKEVFVRFPEFSENLIV